MGKDVTDLGEQTAGREYLRMEHISKRFGGIQALDDVFFSCRKGEAHVLIGENGAGKSTIIKILCGVVARDTGDIPYICLATLCGRRASRRRSAPSSPTCSS